MPTGTPRRRSIPLRGGISPRKRGRNTMPNATPTTPAGTLTMRSATPTTRSVSARRGRRTGTGRTATTDTATTNTAKNTQKMPWTSRRRKRRRISPMPPRMRLPPRLRRGRSRKRRSAAAREAFSAFLLHSCCSRFLRRCLSARRRCETRITSTAFRGGARSFSAARTRTARAPTRSSS